MRTSHRLPPVAVIEELLAQPHSFEFFQAVRLLERWFIHAGGVAPSEVMAQRIFFCNSTSLSFPASEIEKLELIADDKHDGANISPTPQRIEITPAFISLLGAGGVLPLFYTEVLAQHEQRVRDPSARAFLDIFLHRSTVLFYQAWRKHRLSVRYEADRRHEFLPLVLSLAGAGQKALRDRLAPEEGGVSDEMIAFIAGLVQQRTVSAAVLQRVVSLYFRVPVSLTQFVGRSFQLRVEQQFKLGVGNAQLGVSAVVGERVWQRDLRVGMTLGPLPLDRYRRFLPGGPGFRALRELLSLLTGVSLEYEIRLQLRAADVQPARLGGDHPPALGWETFLMTQPGDKDRADAGYDLHACA
jgi:type VI secretion system protein ImpH